MRWKRAHGLQGPKLCRMNGSHITTPLASVSWGSVARKRARRSSPRTPNTARRITSSVIDCMRGRSAKGRAERPALDLALRDVGDQLTVAAHPLAVERRQQQLALAHVVVLVERQQRELPERRLEHAPVGLARVDRARVAREDLLDGLRLGEVGHPPEARGS